MSHGFPSRNAWHNDVWTGGIRDDGRARQFVDRGPSRRSPAAARWPLDRRQRLSISSPADPARIERGARCCQPPASPESDLAGPDAMVACAANDHVFIEANRQRQIPNLMLELASGPRRVGLFRFSITWSSHPTPSATGAPAGAVSRLSGGPVTISIEDSGDPCRCPDRRIICGPGRRVPRVADGAAPGGVALTGDSPASGGQLSSAPKPRVDPAGSLADASWAAPGSGRMNLSCRTASPLAQRAVRPPMVGRRYPVLRQVLETQANEILALVAPHEPALPPRCSVVLSTWRRRRRRSDRFGRAASWQYPGRTLRAAWLPRACPTGTCSGDGRK